ADRSRDMALVPGPGRAASEHQHRSVDRHGHGPRAGRRVRYGGGSDGTRRPRRIRGRPRGPLRVRDEGSVPHRRHRPVGRRLRPDGPGATRPSHAHGRGRSPIERGVPRAGGPWPPRSREQGLMANIRSIQKGRFPGRNDRPEGSVFAEVRTAVSALEAVARDLDPLLLDRRDAAELLAVLGRGKRVCAAMETLLARRVDETKVWRDSGHRSAAHRVAEATGGTIGSASRALETGRALEQLPDTDAAFRAGRLSETQAAEITSTALAD